MASATHEQEGVWSCESGRLQVLNTREPGSHDQVWREEGREGGREGGDSLRYVQYER